MQTAKTTRYIIATIDGDCPSNLLTSESKTIKAIDTCKRGWPDKIWNLFRFSYCEGYLIEIEDVTGKALPSALDKLINYVCILKDLKQKERVSGRLYR